MKITKIFFLILLFLFPVGEMMRISIGSATVHATDIVLALLLPLWIFNNVSHSGLSRIRFWSRAAPQNDAQKAIIFFIGILTLSLAIHVFEYPLSVLASSFLYTIRFACYAMLYPIVFGFPEKFKKTVLTSIIIMGGIIVVLGFMQYFLYPDLRNLYYAGWDEHLYRMFSVFLDPNFAGAFFVCYFLLVLHLFLQKKSNLYGFLSLVTLIAIALTYSRGAYIMLGVSLVVYFFLQKKKIARLAEASAKRAMFRNASFAMIIGIVAIGLLFFLSPKSEGTNLFRTTSSFARLGAVQNTVTIWQDNVLFGVGFDAYRYAQEKHGFLPVSTKDNHAAAGTDNSFLFVLVTTGIVGLAAYCNMMYRIVKDYKGLLRPVVIATIVGLCVNALFVNSLFYSFILIWVFIELGFIDYMLP